MAVFTRSARGRVIGRLPGRVDAVVTEEARSENGIMIKPDNAPACCARVTAFAGVEAKDVVGRLAGGLVVVMAGQAGSRDYGKWLLTIFS